MHSRFSSFADQGSICSFDELRKTLHHLVSSGGSAVVSGSHGCGKSDAALAAIRDAGMTPVTIYDRDCYGHFSFPEGSVLLIEEMAALPFPVLRDLHLATAIGDKSLPTNTYVDCLKGHPVIILKAAPDSSGAELEMPGFDFSSLPHFALQQNGAEWSAWAKKEGLQTQTIALARSFKDNFKRGALSARALVFLDGLLSKDIDERTRTLMISSIIPGRLGQLVTEEILLIQQATSRTAPFFADPDNGATETTESDLRTLEKAGLLVDKLDDKNVGKVLPLFWTEPRIILAISALEMGRVTFEAVAPHFDKHASDQLRDITPTT